MSGNSDLIKYLVRGKRIDATDVFDQVSLYHAARSGNLGSVLHLVEEKGVDINARDVGGETPLHYAAKSGNLDLVEYFVEKGLTFDAEDKSGKTLLHYAAESGNLDLVKYFIEKGLAFDAEDKSGNLGLVKYFVEEKEVCVENVSGLISLLYAAESGNLDLVKYLVEKKGVDVSVKGDYYQMLLCYAAKSGNLELVKYLVEEKGADVNARDISDKTPICYAAESGNLDLVKYFAGKGVGINVKDEDGKILLHYAAESGNLDIVKYLVEKGAYVNIRGYDNKAPLHYAAKNGNLDIVKYLVEEEVDVNARDHGSKTPLHYAAESGNLDMVRYLVDKKADVDAKDASGTTSIDIAKRIGYVGIMEYLEEKLNKGRKKATQRKRRHHHGDHYHDRYNSHLSRQLLAADLSNQHEVVASSSARPSSWINDLFGWVKSSIGGLLGSRAALPETSANYSNTAGTSQFNSEVCISNNVGLGFFLLQSFLDKKYPLPKFCSVTPEEALANTLNIVEEFKKILEKTAKQSGVLVKDVNFFKVYLDIAGHVRNERYSQIPNTLYSAAKEACPKNEKFLSILKGNIKKMFDDQQIVNSGYQPNDIADNKPRSYLSNMTVDKQLQIMPFPPEVV